MYTFSVQTAVADKVKVVSSPQIYRRIKDMYDLAVYATLYSICVRFLYPLYKQPSYNLMWDRSKTAWERLS